MNFFLTENVRGKTNKSEKFFFQNKFIFKKIETAKNTNFRGKTQKKLFFKFLFFFLKKLNLKIQWLKFWKLGNLNFRAKTHKLKKNFEKKVGLKKF